MAKKKKPTAQSLYSKAAIKVRRQLKRLEGREGSKALIEKYRGEFPTLRELGNVSERDLQIMTKKAQSLLQTKTLTTKHERQLSQAVETLRDRGYDYITRSNIDEFFDFLDDARARGLASIYGYEAILDAVNRAKRRGLSSSEIKANIDYWSEHNTGQRLYVRKGRKLRSSSDDF